MAIDNVILRTSFQALEDMTGQQYQAITLADGLVANNGGEASGILLNKPANGEFVSCGVIGEIKFRAGDTITKNSKLTVTDSGYFTVAGSGDYVVGRSKSAADSGSLCTGLFNFTTTIYALSSSFVA